MRQGPPQNRASLPVKVTGRCSRLRRLLRLGDDEAEGPAAGLRPPALPSPVTRSWAARAVLTVGVAAYLGVYLSWSLANYDGFNMWGGGGYDFSIHDQGVWLLSRLHSPFLTVAGTQYFCDHLSFIMVLVVPLYWVFSTGKVLLVLQTLALGLAALPAFLVARNKLRSEWLAVGIGVGYLLNSSVGYTNLEAFHPDVLAVPLVFLAFWLVLRRRWVGFLVSIVLLLLVKEDVLLLVIGLGVWVALRYQRRLRLVTSALGALWLFASIQFLLPILSGTGSLASYVSRHTQRIHFGGLGGFLKTLFLRPWKIAQQAFGPHRPWYYLQNFGPLAFLPLLSPSTLVLLSAPLIANGLSPYFYQHHIEYHYGTLVVPSLFVATVFGIAHAHKPRLRQALVGLLVASALLCAWLWGPLPHTRHSIPWAHPPNPYTQSVDSAMKLIPPEAVVSGRTSSSRRTSTIAWRSTTSPTPGTCRTGELARPRGRAYPPGRPRSPMSLCPAAWTRCHSPCFRNSSPRASSTSSMTRPWSSCSSASHPSVWLGGRPAASCTQAKRPPEVRPLRSHFRLFEASPSFPKY